MTATALEMTLNVDEQIEIAAAPERAFAALLKRLGPESQTPNGESLDMKIEPWPGGRWFRDLGDGQGHLWGHVQVIKRPTLLEIFGPLFMSYPALSHLQFRITETDGACLLELHHQAIGPIDPDHRKGVLDGWKTMLKGIKDHAEHH